MDPLTVFVASIVGAVLADALQQPGEFTQFYDLDLEPGHDWIPMEGGNVTWWVEPGEAVWIEAKYLRPISGNIFYSDKLGAVATAVRQGDPRPQFYASFGQITVITPDDVAESIQYAAYDVGPTLTTGDDELDAWLAGEWLEGDVTDETEGELQARLADAVEAGDGDLGKWMASVRDGNHRAFGSVLGGETRIPIRIYDNDVAHLRERLRQGKVRTYEAELLRRMIRDTGQPAYWMERPGLQHALSGSAVVLDLGPEVERTERGVLFRTGVPVTFDFARNTEPAPYLGEQYAQHIEPAGRYVVTRSVEPEHLPPGWIHGELHFANPIVLASVWPVDGAYAGAEGWKARLSRAFGNRTRADLSRAILDAGFDGIVTVSMSGPGNSPGYVAEIVDLTVVR